ncbi:putative asparagine--tRNA ligase [Helianthus annuus]|nr:putative asparagine--tRNA ligase [Helianthus annuus]
MVHAFRTCSVVIDSDAEGYDQVGTSDPSFPIQKKKVTREFLRSKAHLRPRTNTFGAVARVRNALAYATHKFFQENGFVWVASPIITASDCDRCWRAIPSSKEAIDSPVDAIPRTKNGLIELMIEPELAFADLNDDMACATAYLQYVVKHVLENCKEDMDFFNNWIEKGIHRSFEMLLRKALILRHSNMRLNDDGKTVAAMDLCWFHGVGELIGGSQREERLDYLENPPR